VSYQLKAQEALGLTWEDAVKAATDLAPQAKDYLTKASQGLKAGAAVFDDPYFGEGMCQVLRLQTIEQGKNPGPACPKTVITAANARKGIGLKYVATPMRLAVYARENKWVLPLAAVAIVAVPLALGYVLGKSGAR
jgi:hypothetical protein